MKKPFLFGAILLSLGAAQVSGKSLQRRDLDQTEASEQLQHILGLRSPATLLGQSASARNAGFVIPIPDSILDGDLSILSRVIVMVAPESGGFPEEFLNSGVLLAWVPKEVGRLAMLDLEHPAAHGQEPEVANLR